MNTKLMKSVYKNLKKILSHSATNKNLRDKNHSFKGIIKNSNTDPGSNANKLKSSYGIN